MELQEIPRPVPGPGTVVLQVEAVGICGSELSGYLGQNSLRHPPLVMGHEFAGRVAEVGIGVHLAEGTRVLVNPLVACGECSMCRRGRENLCLRRQLIGAHRPGAFAEYVAVPAGNCLPLPDGLDPVAGSLAEPLACSLRAVTLAALEPMDTVAVMGAGAIGLLALRAAIICGAGLTAVVDTNPHRLALARAWGASRTINPREEDPLAALRDLTGGAGADAVIDAVGLDATRIQAVRAVRPGGRTVMIGLHAAESALPINDMIRSEISLTGTFAYTGRDFARALAMLARGDVRPDPAWLDERELAAGQASFDELIDTPSPFAKIVLKP
jgi:L-iditol 2-dehydrogenase